MGEDARRRRAEVDALKLGLDLGMTLVDTAEMYGEGGAEKVVSEAIEGRRDGVFLVSKVLPENASKAGTIRACERSLARLKTDRLDLYLLHWPGRHPVEDTLDALTRLRAQGKILHHGLSNFDTDEIEEAAALPGGSGIAADQVLYNLGRRGIERRLIPWCRARGVLVMAYSPLEQGRLGSKKALTAVAARHEVSPACVAIAWTIREEGVIAIPKATSPDHVRENARAASLALTPEDLAALDAAFPAPSRDVPLAVL
jgi:diketogulonate reductase-like aldo/keto reductase